MRRLLQHWIREQAERRPDAVALVMSGYSVTYGDLEAHSNQLARLLKEAGCRRGDRICFAIPKSPAAIIAILGILKADCMHVPVDIASPASRVSKIIARSDPRFILGFESVADFVDELFTFENAHQAIRIGWMDSLPCPGKTFSPAFSWGDLQAYSTEPLDYDNKVFWYQLLGSDFLPSPSAF